MKSADILIVEDEYLLALDIKVTLEESGHRVIGIVITGEEALEVLQNERADLVLMDIKLYGESDGIEAARHIKERFGIPVVFVTGNIDGKTRARAMETNPEAFISKPLAEKDLFRILKKVLK